MSIKTHKKIDKMSEIKNTNEALQEVKKISEAVIYKENPFVNEMIDTVKIKHKTKLLRSPNKDTQLMVVNSDSEILGHSAFLQRIEVDEHKFAKLYIDQLASLWELKTPSIKILSYILSVLKPNEDRVYFDINECLEYCGWTGTQSVYNGLLGLVNSKIIARTEKSHFYFINPSVIFNGSRVTFITQYVKKKKQENPNQISLLDQPGVIQDFTNTTD